MLIGYARVSTPDQNLNLQIDALKKAGCERIFSETASGIKSDRSELNSTLSFARPNDTIVVWKLDRLGRSLKDLAEPVNGLHNSVIGLRSWQENLDTTSPSGKLFFHIFGALAECERDSIRQRTKAGLMAARARGRFGGRPRLLDSKKIQ